MIGIHFSSSLFQRNYLVLHEFLISQTIAFTSTVFHPKVDPISGYMETRSAFGKWQCGVHHIWHLLLYIKRSLLVIDERNAVNLLAADLWVEFLLLMYHLIGFSLCWWTRISKPSQLKFNTFSCSIRERIWIFNINIFLILFSLVLLMFFLIDSIDFCYSHMSRCLSIVVVAECSKSSEQY